jgi:tRNA (cytidine32/uridine32-2'-O)-methyltransferase
MVLVAPSHPGNIGAAARAMKNMGLESLVLVNPRQFPHPEAQARASGAADVLAAARIMPSLTAALAGCGYVAATTARDRDQYFRVIDVREAAGRLVAEARRAPAAVVFGPERSGLSNEELERLYGHFGEVLEQIDFRDRTQSGTHLMARIRRLLQRAELDQNEVNILRGILTAVQNRRRSAGGAR